MNLKLLFFCFFLAVLLIPAEPKHKKERHRHRHRHHHHHHHPEPHKHHGLGNPKHGKRGTFEELIKDYFFELLSRLDDDDDEEDDDPYNTDWLFDLLEPEGECNPNPCLNNGECKEKDRGKYKCDCLKPFKGKRCEKGPKYCKKGKCGRGECVLTSVSPFFECKCKEPFQPPRCRTFSVCEPNPCRNGGSCIRDGNDFDCQCPPGFRGRFCHVGPNDCYVDDGESYRGNVSETDDGDECLYWNSHFILKQGMDPFSSFEDKDGLGPHNFCRNPDGENEPWCFIRRGHKLFWDYCDVTECPEPTDVTPTEIATQDPKPQPTTVPRPVTTKPSTTEKPSQAPQPATTAAIATLTATTAAPTATAAPQQFSTCGKAQPKLLITRIYGGLKVPPGATPWQVSLQVRTRNSNQAYTHICGGVLIESCWVLTAGHCILPDKDMQVVIGGLSLYTEDSTEQTINVEEAIKHESYRETLTSVTNDIALLRLRGTDGVCANETQFVKAVCLPDAQLPDGMECTISGWGATDQSHWISNHLLEANVLLIGQEKCSESHVYGNLLDNSMFCAGHLQGGVDSCQGDSGGPLTCKQNNVSVVYGVVSWGDQCGKKNKPGVYTRVTHFLDWIKSKIQAASP